MYEKTSQIFKRKLFQDQFKQKTMKYKYTNNFLKEKLNVLTQTVKLSFYG